MADELKPVSREEIEAFAGAQAARREKVRTILAECHPDLRPSGDMVAALAALPYIAVRSALAATRPAPKADSALVGELQDLMRGVVDNVMPDEGFMLPHDLADRILAALSDRDVVLEGLLRDARERLRAIQGACGDYLPPDSGISEHDLANTVIGLTDDRAYISLVTRIDAALKGGVDE